MLVEIITISTGTNNGTIGQLFIDHKSFCKTIECEWKDNEKYISCIPSGRYKLKPLQSPKYGLCYYLESRDDESVRLYGPAKRTSILIHPANKASQLQGCIGVGSLIFVLDGKVAVYESKDTFYALRDVLGRQEHELIIKRY